MQESCCNLQYSLGFGVPVVRHSQTQATVLHYLIFSRESCRCCSRSRCILWRSFSWSKCCIQAACNTNTENARISVLQTLSCWHLQNYYRDYLCLKRLTQHKIKLKIIIDLFHANNDDNVLFQFYFTYESRFTVWTNVEHCFGSDNPVLSRPSLLMI